MTYSGIDYGMGQTNIDKETGIRYGVINANTLSEHAWDTIQSNGTDLDYAEAVEIDVLRGIPCQERQELASLSASAIPEQYKKQVERVWQS